MASPVPTARRSRQRALDAALWALTFASAGLTVWLSLGSVPPGASAFPGADKLFHGIAFFVTTLLFLFAAVWRPGRGPGPFAGLVPYVLLAVIAAGLVVEALQGALTADRRPELADWLAEVVAVIAAASVHGALRRTIDRPAADAGDAEDVSV
jgi:hypothetical protein